MTDKKVSPFEHMKRINVSNEKPDIKNLESFNSFLAESYYSMYSDTILLAELCSMLNVPDYIKETFLRGVIDKGQRKHFWPKSTKDEKIQVIKEEFNVSYEKSLEILSLIPNSTYSKIKEKYK